MLRAIRKFVSRTRSSRYERIIGGPTDRCVKSASESCDSRRSSSAAAAPARFQTLKDFLSFQLHPKEAIANKIGSCHRPLYFVGTGYYTDFCCSNAFVVAPLASYCRTSDSRSRNLSGSRNLSCPDKSDSQ